MIGRRTRTSNSSQEEKSQLDHDHPSGAGASASVAANMLTDEMNENESQRHENRVTIDFENDANENASNSLELAIKKISAKLDKIAIDTEGHGKAIAAMGFHSI